MKEKRLQELEQRAIEHGVDLHLLERTLQMTPDERVLAHESALALAETLREAVRKYHEKPRKPD